MNSTDHEALVIENAQLRRRIHELEEQQLPHRPRTGRATTAGDVFRRELPGKIADEVESLGRASAFAFLEHLDSTADTIKSVTDEALLREQLHDAHFSGLENYRRSEKPLRMAIERTAELPDDVAALTATAVAGILKSQRRVLEKFFLLYRNPGRAAVTGDPAGLGEAV